MLTLTKEGFRKINEMNHRLEVVEQKLKQVECEHPQEDIAYGVLTERPRSGWVNGWRRKTCSLCGKNLGLVKVVEKDKTETKPTLA